MDFKEGGKKRVWFEGRVEAMDGRNTLLSQTLCRAAITQLGLSV